MNRGRRVVSGARQAPASSGRSGHPSDRDAAATLATMRELVRASLRSPIVVNTARRIVGGLAPRDARAHALAIREWLHARVRFIPDPTGVEMLEAPEWMLAQIERRGFYNGDCDAAATLGAALGAAVGIPALLRAVSFGSRGAPFVHVYAVLGAPGGPLELDVTRPARNLPPTVARNLDLRV